MGDEGNEKQASAKRSVRQEFLLRTNRSVQQQKGYKSLTEDEKTQSPNSYYLGDPYYLSFRYRLRVADKIHLGLSGEKDPGEPLWSEQQKGLDFYAYNLTINNVSIFEQVQAGKYRLAFGQGLVLNNNFGMGKTAHTANLSLRNQGIRAHVSTNESDYFRGVAGRMKLGSSRLTLFYSNRPVDANTNGSRILSFKTDGLHRTNSDWEKKNTATVNLTGVNLDWQNEQFALGATIVYYQFGGRELDPTARHYNTYYLRGKDHLNGGVHYSYRWKRSSLTGETAIDRRGRFASLNHLQLHPHSDWNVTLSLRYYDKAYNALYGKAFSESTDLRNETGVYLGASYQGWAGWTFSGYADVFHFPFARYGVDKPSSGFETMLRADYASRQGWQAFLRYRLKQKEKNHTSGNTRTIESYRTHRWRGQINCPINDQWKLRTQADYTLYILDRPEQGWSVIQAVGWRERSGKMQLDGGLSYFHTDSWETRISTYEKNVLYTFSFPSFYGQGLRYFLVAQWEPRPALTCYLKAANTHYLDRSTIGSGLENIEGKNRTDIYLQLRFQF